MTQESSGGVVGADMVWWDELHSSQLIPLYVETRRSTFIYLRTYCLPFR